MVVTEMNPPKPRVKDSKKPKLKKLPNKTLKLVKHSHPSQENMFPQGFSFPNLQPPDGFRLVSASQALTEFAGPFMEMIPMPDYVSKANEVFGVVTTIWNYTIDEKVIQKKNQSETEMVSLIQEKLGLDKDKSHDFLSMMVERKQYLFPAEVQQKGSPFMFIRKEVISLISRFDYEGLKLNPEVLPPNALDIKLVRNLNKLDQYIKRSADYDKYKKQLLNVLDGVFERFNMWLAEKRVIEHQDQFSFIIEEYLDFIYTYEHEPPLILKDGPEKYLAEFVMDYLLRKTPMEPWEYTLAPSALRLFYRFLYEKEYLGEPPDGIVDFMDKLEPVYIEHLKEQFS